MNRQGGFTLIEVLLAVAILSIVVGMVYRSLELTSQVADHVNEVSGQYRTGRLALSKISDELMSAFYFKEDGNTRFGGVDGVGANGMDADTLGFTSLSRIVSPDTKASYQNELHYQMQGDTLWHSEVLNPLGIGPGNKQSFPLAEGLSGFRLRYLPKKGAEWIDQWTDGDGLPAAVEVSLLFPGDAGDEDGVEAQPVMALSTVVRMPAGGI